MIARLTKAELLKQLNAANVRIGELEYELNKMLVQQRPSRRVATPEQAQAHNAYREALRGARELAMKTGKSVLVTTKGV